MTIEGEVDFSERDFAAHVSDGFGNADGNKEKNEQRLSVFHSRLNTKKSETHHIPLNLQHRLTQIH